MKSSFFRGRALVLAFVLLVVVTTATAAAKKKKEESCSCVRDWLLRAGLSRADAKKYEKIIDSTGLALPAIRKMNTVVFGLLLQGNVNDAKKIQMCIGGLSAKCRGHNPCQKGGVCLSSSKGKPSTCKCAKGLTGCLCQIDIDECKSAKLNNCDNTKRAACTNTHGSFVCSCRKGYSGNGQKCIDVDECKKNTHSCHKYAKCTNTIGNYTCKCKPSYSGDGWRGCKRDLCSGEKNSEVCKVVKTLRVKVHTLQKSLDQQQYQTRLLTNVITQFLMRTAKLDKRLTAESGHVTRLRQDVTKLQSQCTGIFSWKHYTKRTRSRFMSWQVSYKKKRKDTSLRVSYSGSLGVQGYNSGHWYCTRIRILFNGNECSNPAPITSGFVHRKDNGNWWTYSMAPAMVTGHCNGLASGSVTVRVSLQNVCSGSNVHNFNGDGPMTKTYSLNVEEFCP